MPARRRAPPAAPATPSELDEMATAAAPTPTSVRRYKLEIREAPAPAANGRLRRLPASAS